MQGPWSYDDSMGGHTVATSSPLDSAASGDGGASSVRVVEVGQRPELPPER
jgi:hypothetical protein